MRENIFIRFSIWRDALSCTILQIHGQSLNLLWS